MYPLKFQPIYVKTVWGSDRLAEIRGVKEGFGSAWDVSAHKNADNVIINGKFKGKSLIEMLNQYKEDMLGDKDLSKMIRLSYLDASDSLSIQVHPNNEYARKYENDEGKVECWYILRAEPNSKLIAGTTTSSVDTIKKAIENDNIEEYVNRIEMEKDDFILIDSGELHAFGGGMIALEISQNSDTTYRFYDFHRKDKNGVERELHLDKCFDVADFTKKGEKIHIDKKEGTRFNIVNLEEFTVDCLDINGEYNFVKDDNTFYGLSNVGDSTIKILYDNEVIEINKTESIFVPAKCKSFVMKGNSRVIITYVK